VSGIEHDSIFHTVNDVGEEGAEIIFIPAGKDGIVSNKDVIEAINERTILVSLMTANNETGAMQPVNDIGKAIREIRKERNGSLYPIFHTDAAQALRYVDCRLDNLNADIVTISGHKIGGPRGAGALAMKPIGNYGLQKAIYPLITGGGQEFGMRSGTENVSAIFGFGEAMIIAEQEREKNIKKVLEIRRFFWEELNKAFPKAAINGPAEKEWEKNSSPHILNIWLPGHSSADIVMKCDMAGIALSYGSACGAKRFKPSHVLKAMGYSEKRVKESVRISFSPANTIAEAKDAVKRMNRVL
jgi:cysteine desulfurase